MKNLLFIGIVGHAMRGLALAAKRQGNTVRGLDETAEDGPATIWLATHGIEWTRKPELSLLDGVDLVIISGGSPAGHPLIQAALARHIPVQSMAEYFGSITKDEHTIAIAGTHGKTTTTSLITWLLESAGRSPDFLIGVKPANFDSSVRFKHAKDVVIEGDEYKSSSLDLKPKLHYYHPNTLVLTAIEHDHPDVYPDLESYKAAFAAVIKTLPTNGQLIACVEGPNVPEIAKFAPCPVTTYGLDNGDYTAANVTYGPAGLEFDVAHQGNVLGRLAVALHGRHNVRNALAAVAAGLANGLTFEQIAAGAKTFAGTYRRFNIVTPPGAAVTVVDDYGHHPSEVATNLEAAKLHFPGHRIIAVVRPHTFSRTTALLTEWQQSFTDADQVFVTDIEAAREAASDQTVSGADIVKGITQSAHYQPDRSQLIADMKISTKPGDVVLCFTVSGYQNLAQQLAETLNP